MPAGLMRSLLIANRGEIARRRGAARMKCFAGPGVILILAASPASAERQSFTRFCDYINLGTDQSYRGPCIETWDDVSGEHVIRVQRSTFSLSERSRQGVWSLVTMNGRAAMRYEHNRTRYSYATEDLQEFLEIADTLSALDDS